MLNQGEADCRTVCFSAFWALLMRYMRPFHRSEEVSLLFQKVTAALKRRAQNRTFAWRTVLILSHGSREDKLGRKEKKEK